ncbi:MAG: M64 family metallopeptidase, partial [Polyangiaceae bacterium]
LRFVESFETGTPAVTNVRLRVDASASFPYPVANTVQPTDFATEFPAGSIVYAPTRAPDVAYDATAYPYAEVIAKNIREHITHRVGTGQPGALATGGDFPQVPDYSGFTFPHCFPTAQYPRVVALYEGGIGNNTGVFHPTGDCMMSDQDSGSQFCHVCKYMLVDAIDPSKHYFLDREYDRFYPQR